MVSLSHYLSWCCQLHLAWMSKSMKKWNDKRNSVQQAMCRDQDNIANIPVEQATVSEPSKIFAHSRLPTPHSGCFCSQSFVWFLLWLQQELNNRYDRLLEDCQELRGRCTFRPPRLLFAKGRRHDNFFYRFMTCFRWFFHPRAWHVSLVLKQFGPWIGSPAPKMRTRLVVIWRSSFKSFSQDSWRL